MTYSFFLDKDILILWQERHFNSLTAYLTFRIARNFEFYPRMSTVTDKWALIFPEKTSLYSSPSCLNKNLTQKQFILTSSTIQYSFFGRFKIDFWEGFYEFCD